MSNHDALAAIRAAIDELRQYDPWGGEELVEIADHADSAIDDLAECNTSLERMISAAKAVIAARRSQDEANGPEHRMHATLGFETSLRLLSQEVIKADAALARCKGEISEISDSQGLKPE